MKDLDHCLEILRRIDREDRKLLDELNRRIDEAPANAKPVFQGIVGLHARVHRYEAARGLESHQ